MRRELKWKVNIAFVYFTMLIYLWKTIRIQPTLYIYRNRFPRTFSSQTDYSGLTCSTEGQGGRKNLVQDPSTYFKEKTEGSSFFSSSSSSSDSSDLFFSAEELLLLGEKSGVNIQILNSTQDGPYNRLSYGFTLFRLKEGYRKCFHPNRKWRFASREW